MQKQIFRKYDIRGVVGQSLLISEAYRLAQAIVVYFLKQNKQAKRVVIGMDVRIHSEAIYQEVARAVVEAGLDIYFLGVCPTPLLLYVLHNLPVDAGIMITASHNTKEYNGFKLYNKKKSLYDGDIAAVYELYEAAARLPKAAVPGKIVPCPIIDQYVDVLYQHFPHLSQYDFKMIIDCGNGTVGSVLRKIIEKMEWKHIYLLNEKADGSFPNHEADPTVKENMQQLIAKLQLHPGYFGIGFDGDGDRMIGVTAAGEMIFGDVMLALFAQDMLQDYPDKQIAVVYDVKSSSLVQDVITAGRGKAIVSQTGCSFIQEKMDESAALLGGELSGHYFFRDRHAGYDDALYAMLRLFAILVRKRASMDDLLAAVPRKHVSCEIRIPCDDLHKESIVSKVGDQFHLEGWTISKVDGIRAQHAKGWGLLRASHTQPAVSFRCEADTERDVAMIKDKFSQALKMHIHADIIDQYLL